MVSFSELQRTHLATRLDSYGNINIAVRACSAISCATNNWGFYDIFVQTRFPWIQQLTDMCYGRALSYLLRIAYSENPKIMQITGNEVIRDNGRPRQSACKAVPRSKLRYEPISRGSRIGTNGITGLQPVAVPGWATPPIAETPNLRKRAIKNHEPGNFLPRLCNGDEGVLAGRCKATLYNFNRMAH